MILVVLFVLSSPRGNSQRAEAKHRAFFAPIYLALTDGVKLPQLAADSHLRGNSQRAEDERYFLLCYHLSTVKPTAPTPHNLNLRHDKSSENETLYNLNLRHGKSSENETLYNLNLRHGKSSENETYNKKPVKM